MLEGSKSHRVAVAAGILAVAALSLLLPFAPVYDAWGWLVWGREVGSLDLDTGGGPSWKPLPVIFTTAFGFAGDAAPSLWLVVARAGWIAAALLAAKVAMRLAPTRDGRIRLAAGVVAGAGVLLFDDPFTSWLRQFAGGLSEPLLVAVILGAVDRELDGHRGQAFGLGVAAALLRPEVWPFLALYGAWLWRERALERRALVAGAAAIPILWLVPDLIGSGDALTGAGRARSGTGSPPGEALEAVGRCLELAPWAMWPAAAYAAARTWIRGEHTVPVLAAFAVGWIGVVAVLAALGYAGLPRFGAPAAALGCVLGAVGLVVLYEEFRSAQRLAERLRSVRLGVLITRDRYRRAVLGLGVLVSLCAALVLQGALRAGEVPGQFDAAREFGERIDDLDALVSEVGADRLVRCDEVATSDLLVQTAIAWNLEVPMGGVGVRVKSLPRRGTMIVRADMPRALRSLVEVRGERLGGNRSWDAYAVSCGADSARPALIAGVTGARR